MSGAKSAPGGLTATARESDTNRRNGSEAATLQMSHRLQSLSLAAVTNSHLRDICYRPFLFIFYEVPQNVGWCDPVQ